MYQMNLLGTLKSFGDLKGARPSYKDNSSFNISIPTKQATCMGPMTDLIIALFPIESICIIKYEGTDWQRSKVQNQISLKETKLVGRPESELQWKLQNLTINHYFLNCLILRF